MMKKAFFLLLHLSILNFVLPFYIELNDNTTRFYLRSRNDYNEVLNFIKGHQNNPYYSNYQKILNELNLINPNIYNLIDSSWAIVARHVCDPLWEIGEFYNPLYMIDELYYYPFGYDLALVHYSFPQKQRPYSRFYSSNIKNKNLFSFSRTLHDSLGNVLENENNNLPYGFVGICKTGEEVNPIVNAIFDQGKNIIIRTYGGDSGNAVFIESGKNTENLYDKYLLLGFQNPAAESINITNLANPSINNWINKIILSHVLNPNMKPDKEKNNRRSPAIRLYMIRSLPISSDSTLIDCDWIIGTEKNIVLGDNKVGKGSQLETLSVNKLYKLTNNLENNLMIGHLDKPYFEVRPLQRSKSESKINDDLIIYSTQLKTLVKGKLEDSIREINPRLYGIAQFKSSDNLGLMYLYFPDNSRYPRLIIENKDNDGSGDPILKLMKKTETNQENYQLAGIISDIKDQTVQAYNLSNINISAQIDKVILIHFLSNQ